MEENLVQKLNRESDGNFTYAKEYDWKGQNEYWLKKSKAICLKVLCIIKEKSMSQKELAIDLHVSPSRLSEILKGTQNLSLETICRIEKVLKVDLITV